MNLPNFLIAGMPRCGTTAAHEVISRHPDIFLSPGASDRNNREIWFYNSTAYEEKGYEWYQKFFEGASGEKYVGEKTPLYMREQCLERIRGDLGPDVKFLMCVRDPVVRPYSHYVHAHMHKYGEKYRRYSFGRCIRDRDINWSFIERSSYGKAIRAFSKYFDRNNLYIMINEEVKVNPDEEYSKFFNWLGLQPLAPDACDFSKEINLSDYNKYGNIDEDDIYFLKESLKYDTEEFYNFIGREIEAWK